jgi:hypothetical protein
MKSSHSRHHWLLGETQVLTKFEPPRVFLAFESQLPGETTYQTVFPNPLSTVIESLTPHQSVASHRANLPDMPADAP